MKQREILPEIKRVVEQILPGAELILFGSIARGDEKEDSDIDILILVNKEEISDVDTRNILFTLDMLEIEKKVHISPILRTRRQWENPPLMTPFILNVRNEGIAL